MKRKTRKLESKLTATVDGEGRSKAESLINEQFRELLTDVSEIIAKAVRKNTENPFAELGLDRASSKRAAEILLKLYEKFDGNEEAKRTAIRSLKRTLNRLDVCYLASAANLSSRSLKALTTLKKRVSTVLENGVRVPYEDELGSAVPSSKNRKFVPAVKQKRLREDAKLLSGKSLQTKVLNVVDERLGEFFSGGGKKAEGFISENAVRVTNAIHSTLKQTVESAVDAVKSNPVMTGAELEELVYGELSPKFGASRAFTKIASRAVVSSSLNVAILDETERLVNLGVLTPQDFFLNRPSFLYKAVMDLRTSDKCRTLNGLIIPLNDKARLIRYMPPQHANCRSILIPNLRQ